MTKRAPDDRPERGDGASLPDPFVSALYPLTKETTMAVIAVGFVFSLFIWFAQKKEQAKLFPPGLCANCKEAIHFTHGKYVHTETGEQIAETIWELSGDGGAWWRESFGPSFHPALPPSTLEEQAMYQS